MGLMTSPDHRDLVRFTVSFPGGWERPAQAPPLPEYTSNAVSQSPQEAQAVNFHNFLSWTCSVYLMSRATFNGATLRSGPSMHLGCFPTAILVQSHSSHLLLAETFLDCSSSIRCRDKAIIHACVRCPNRTFSLLKTSGVSFSRLLQRTPQ